MPSSSTPAYVKYARIAGRFIMSFFCRFAFLAALLFACHPACAEKRVALVVGNSNYKNAAVLPNPGNDATAIAATLRNAGFDIVDSRLDLTANEMRRVLRDFAEQARDSDVAVVYYAGHGIEIDGTNYLIPTDATLQHDTDVYDEAFSLDRVLLTIEPARQLRLVIVDACRNNPFAETMKRTVSSRAISRGLARIEPNSTNTLVAFAAKAGLTALDGASKNSPYAMALIRHIATPGLDVRRAFGYIRDDVLQATGNRQEPYVYGSLGGADIALVPVAPVAPTRPATSAQSEIRQDFELALQVGNQSALNAFLAQYPDGFYASLARLQLAKINAEDARVAATEKARLAERERARLAAEGAQRKDQEKAAADAKDAEERRLAAEKIKQAVQDRVAEAERRRLAADMAADGKPPERIASANIPIEPPAGGAVAIERKQGPSPASPSLASPNLASPNLASLNPEPSAGPPEPSQADLARSVQAELRRVGCLTGAADGEWSAASQRSLTLFNKHAGTKFNVRLASLDALDAIKLRPGRVCPLACEHGFRPDGETCSRIVCAAGSFLNDDNECEKRRAKRPVARSEPDEQTYRAYRAAQEWLHEAGVPQPRAIPGQIICDRGGCRPIGHGCHLEFRTTAQGGPYEGGGGNVQVCR
jgi:Caspase domain